MNGKGKTARKGASNMTPIKGASNKKTRKYTRRNLNSFFSNGQYRHLCSKGGLDNKTKGQYEAALEAHNLWPQFNEFVDNFNEEHEKMYQKELDNLKQFAIGDKVAFHYIPMAGCSTSWVFGFCKGTKFGKGWDSLPQVKLQHVQKTSKILAYGQWGSNSLVHPCWTDETDICKYVSAYHCQIYDENKDYQDHWDNGD